MFVEKYTKELLIAAAFIMLVSVALLFKFGLLYSIDFTGGALTEVTYAELPQKQVLESELTRYGESINLGGFSLRETTDEAGRDGYILRSRDLTEPERQSIEEIMISLGEDGSLTRFTSIGPVIGEELKDKAIWAIGAVALIIVLYVAFAFRGVSHPVGSWTYGGITILALLHDVLVPAALMSVLGLMLGAEIDVLFVVAMLTILGYSVNDTIVIFDRIRENLIRYRQEKKVKQNGEEKVEYLFTKPFGTIIGESVKETIGRSINTSLTTLLALLALFFLGGDVTKNFSLVLVAGVIAGAYSSICIASPLLIYLGNKKLKEQS